MESQSLLHADYLDIIFDHRNKAYGGYQLRKYYNARALKALSITLLAVCILFAYSLVPKKEKSITLIPDHTVVTTITDIITDPPPMIIPPPQATPPAQAQTQAFTNPIIVRNDPDPSTILQPVDPNIQIGLHTQDGDPNSTSIIPGTTTGTNNTIGVEPPVNTEPLRAVQQLPAFNGDLIAWLSQHINYPEAARQNGIEGRVAVEFVVNEDGSITNARVLKSIGGGCDEEALRVVKSMPHWKPGKQNGKPVKVYFTLPVLFKLN